MEKLRIKTNNVCRQSKLGIDNVTGLQDATSK
jgi:hypothetical protein